MRKLFFIASMIMFSLTSSTAWTQTTPWGTATSQIAGYGPQKVIYDVTADTPEELDQVLERAQALSTEYGATAYDASIVIVLRGPEMQFFDIRHFNAYEELVRKAQNLTEGRLIELRMCQWSARKLGLQPEHIHGFIDMVPLGDAEIIRLQQDEDYAYIR